MFYRNVKVLVPDCRYMHVDKEYAIKDSTAEIVMAFQYINKKNTSFAKELV